LIYDNIVKLGAAATTPHRDVV